MLQFQNHQSLTTNNTITSQYNVGSVNNKFQERAHVISAGIMEYTVVQVKFENNIYLWLENSKQHMSLDEFINMLIRESMPTSFENERKNK